MTYQDSNTYFTQAEMATRNALMDTRRLTDWIWNALEPRKQKPRRAVRRHSAISSSTLRDIGVNSQQLRYGVRNRTPFE